MGKKQTKRAPRSATTRIEVTARFEVRFYRNVSAAELAALENGVKGIEDIVDESEAYAQASTGDCEMEWDYVGAPPSKLKAVS